MVSDATAPDADGSFQVAAAREELGTAIREELATRLPRSSRPPRSGKARGGVTIEVDGERIPRKR